MAINLYALPWWGWIACGVGGIAVWALTAFLVDFLEGVASIVVWLIGVFAAFAGAISIVIGVVHGLKWAWTLL
jgi:hypothetical protein